MATDLLQTKSDLVSRGTPSGQNATKPTAGRTANIYPKNWERMFGIDKTLNPNIANDMFIEFEARTTPKIRYLSTYKTHDEAYDFTDSKVIDSWKIWLPNDEITEEIEHTYAVGGSTYDEMMNAWKEHGASLVRAGQHAYNYSTQGPIYDAPKLWQDSLRRTFLINIGLFAFDDLNSDVYDIIKFFRNNSYASKAGSLAGVGIVDYPPVWKISGGVWRFINGRGNYYTLEGVKVNYADKIKIVRGGYPIQATLSLKFVECMVMMKDMFDATPVNINIATAGAGGDYDAGKTAELRRITKANSVRQSSSAESFNQNFSNGSSLRPEVQAMLTGWNWARTGGRGIPAQSVAPTKGPQSTIGSPPASPTNAIVNLVKTQVLQHGDIYRRLVGNLERRLIELIQTKILTIINESRFMKKVTALTDIDPRLRVEVLSKLRKIRIAKLVV